MTPGIYMVDDRRTGITPGERLSPVTLCSTYDDPPYGDRLLCQDPFSEHGRTFTVPDEDDAESLEISASEDLLRYITPKGVVIFRKVTAADAEELMVHYPALSFPEDITDAALTARLHELLFLPPM